MGIFYRQILIFLNKSITNMFFIFILVFGVLLPSNITPVYATSAPSYAAYYPVYTSPLLNQLSIDKAQDILTYVHQFLFPNFADTHYYEIVGTGSGTSFRYRVHLFPKSMQFYLRGNGYTAGSITSFTFSHKGGSYIRYDFTLDGKFSTQSSGTMSAGSFNPSQMYYTSLPASIPAVNFDYNPLVPEGFYNLYSQGGKVNIDDSHFKSSSTVLGQGPVISDANLIKIMDVINEKEPYWKNNYYIIRPIMTSTLITHWQVLIVPQREQTADYVFNHFLAYDYDTTEWIDTISLQTKGSKYPVKSYTFDTGFNFLISSQFTDITNVDYTHTPVSYSDVSTEMRIVSAQSPDPSIYVTVEDSPELRAAVGQRPLPDSVMDKYRDPLDVKLTSDMEIADSVLIKMFNYVGANNKNWYVSKGAYALYTNNSDYVFVLSHYGAGRFLGEVKDPNRLFGVLLNPKTPVVKWNFWQPDASVAGKPLMFYTFNSQGDFIRLDTAKEEFIKDVTAKIHYGNALCSTYGSKGEGAQALLPHRDCANYGLRAVPVKVYNDAIVPWNEGLEFIDGSYDQAHTIDTALPSILNLLNNFFMTNDTLKPLIGFMPNEFISLADIALKVFVFMFVYKIIRIIRGLTV